MDALRLIGLLLYFPASMAMALSIDSDEVVLSIGEAQELGIEVAFEPVDPRCRYAPSIQVSAPQELDSMELLAVIAMYVDSSGSVLFLEDASGGSMCPSRQMDYLLLEYGGGPSKAVFTRIRVEMRELGSSYNNGFNSDAGKAGAG